MSGGDVQAIGFSIVAVLVFLNAIPLIGQTIVYRLHILSFSPHDPGRMHVVRSMWQTGLSGGLQLVLAVILFLQARGLVNLWRRIQAGEKHVGAGEAGQDRPHD